MAGPTIDLVLSCCDALTQQVESIASGDPLVSHFELLRSLSAYDTKTTEQDINAEQHDKNPSEATVISSVTVKLDEAASAPAVRAFVIHQKMSKAAVVVESNPTVDDIKAGRLRGPSLRFELGSRLNPADLRQLRNLTGVKEITVRDVDVAQSPTASSNTDGFFALTAKRTGRKTKSLRDNSC
ncbi:MAG: hypothetical protein R3C68_09750 [Myxococcota bacterium]